MCTSNLKVLQHNLNHATSSSRLASPDSHVARPPGHRQIPMHGAPYDHHICSPNAISPLGLRFASSQRMYQSVQLDLGHLVGQLRLHVRHLLR